ncbi:hypothetical protein LRS73_08380 [Methylobacterium currus]|uniref:hypothetical protein n=1 Tax=Methylobacterium currus TaxID=2051553 RepID=UPI001E46602A|nr:hypothetical protein [Methylobacterium currus]UHC17859.1 hypothetical protein LRS73_08380 [Methylobacterium currus]
MRHQIGLMARTSERLLRRWQEDLLSFVPPSFRRSFAKLAGKKSLLIIQCHQGTLIASDGTTAPHKLLARARSEFVILKIDRDHVLCRRMEVPRAVVDSLDTALSMNIGVWTPFSADDVYALAHRIESEFRGLPQTPRVSIEVRCASRTIVDRHINCVRSLEIEPDAIHLGDEKFVLIRNTKKYRLRRWNNRISIILMIVFIIQTLVFSVLIAGSQSAEIERLTADQTHLRQSLRHKAQAEKQIARRNEMLKKILLKISESQSVSQAMQVLARTMPSGVVVLDLEISRDRGEGHLTVSGPRDLDLVTTLSSTKIFRARDLTATSSTDGMRRTYSVGFTLAEWGVVTNGAAP